MRSGQWRNIPYRQYVRLRIVYKHCWSRLKSLTTALDLIRSKSATLAAVALCLNGSCLKIPVGPGGCQRAGERPCPAESATEQWENCLTEAVSRRGRARRRKQEKRVRLVHDSVTCCQGRPKPHVGCLSHESYDSMVKVPLIMNKYAEEQSGWWQWDAA